MIRSSVEHLKPIQFPHSRGEKVKLQEEAWYGQDDLISSEEHKILT